MTGIHPTYRPADWRPLERALEHEFGTAAKDATAAFWFIGFVAGPDDVGELRIYEHSATRRRLALDREGQAYRWFSDASRFARIDIGQALVETFV
ncbi:MAG TPA: hypothetical protein VE869_15405 [Gemmatimonas sp.]|nr:hypothetical protein [Gemmatimonas sp.]